MAENNEGGNEGTDETKATRKSAYTLPDDDAGAAAGGDAGSAGAAAATLDGPIGEALRESLRNFVVEKVVPAGQKGGKVDLNLDVDFIRQHGADLVSSLIQGIAKAVIPENMQMHLPLAQDEKAEKGEGDEGSEDDVDVAVNFDFVNFLKGLITSPVAASAPADDEASAASEAGETDETTAPEAGDGDEVADESPEA